jgi:hypothetical protein
VRARDRATHARGSGAALTPSPRARNKYSRPRKHVGLLVLRRVLQLQSTRDGPARTNDDGVRQRPSRLPLRWAGLDARCPDRRKRRSARPLSRCPATWARWRHSRTAPTVAP